jgi:hypothetical protein
MFFERSVSVNARYLGFLRVGIDGSWGVGEFASLLTDLNEAYVAAYKLDWLSEILAEAKQDRLLIAEGKLEELSVTDDLRLRSVHYGSPGLMEVLGGLNPLRVIFDFVSQWRTENTSRQHQERAFTLELLDRIGPDLRDKYATELLEQINQLRPAVTDQRVIEVTLIEGHYDSGTPRGDSS